MPNPKVDLSVQKTAFGGDGIAFHEGKTCFVEGALPGEEVQAEIVQEKKDLLRLRVVRVLKSSPYRVEPPCEYYGRCGGCQYQHVSYEEELRMKETQIRDVLKKIAGIEAPVLPITGAGTGYGYRNSATFHVGPAVKNKPPQLCYVHKDNVTLLPVKSCDLLNPSLRAVFEHPLRIAKGTEKISFKSDEKGALFSDQDELFYRVRLGGHPLVANSKGFFQNNLPVTELLCKKISEWVRKAAPNVFYDLYAGTGAFSLLCAQDIPRIVCVEESPFAVSALRMNKEEGKFKNMEIVEARVERAFPQLWSQAPSEDALIFLDPPRQGLEKKLAQFLSEKCRAGAMIYVSCDIATLARDLKLMSAGGYWNIREIAPFDMFPRTKHMEAAVLLTGPVVESP